MSIKDLFEPGRNINTVTHFASFMKLFCIEGAINKEEVNIWKRLAETLDLSIEENKFW